MLNPFHKSTSDSELKRRQDLILSVMDEHHVDAAVMYNSGDMVGGPFKWATDFSHYYSMAAILCKECVAIFRSGNERQADEDIPVVSKGLRLPERVWSCPYVHGAAFNSDRFGEAMAYFIRSHNYRKIGWVGLNYISASVYKYLTENLTDVEFVDLTPAVDEVRLVKSPEELEGYLESVDLHDRLIQYCTATIRPGLTIRELNLEILFQAALLGAVEFNTSLIRGWREERALDPDEQLLAGDYIYILVEVAAKGGEWAECARLFRLGAAPDKKWIDIADKLAEMQQKVADRCVPGAIAEEVFEYCKQLQIEAGYYPELRMCIHGQGVDIVDLPIFTKGDKTVLKEGMFIAIHPAWQNSPEGWGAPYLSYTDNFLVEKQGARRLSKAPQEIITVGI
ncbi:M24 family metallopeptidase [Lachnospiraceae bacterium 62-35]